MPSSLSPARRPSRRLRHFHSSLRELPVVEHEYCGYCVKATHARLVLVRIRPRIAFGTSPLSGVSHIETRRTAYAERSPVKSRLGSCTSLRTGTRTTFESAIRRQSPSIAFVFLVSDDAQSAGPDIFGVNQVGSDPRRPANGNDQVRTDPFRGGHRNSTHKEPAQKIFHLIGCGWTTHVEKYHRRGPFRTLHRRRRCRR